jgi:glycosyltransferase involved in cell wall biosynthesis
MTQAIAENRIAGIAASLHLPPISIAQFRHWLAPSGGKRETLGRKVARAARRVRRGVRVGVQEVVRTAGWSLPASIPAGVAQSLHERPTAPYDVICLPVFDWGFRFQRPQQLMRQFARHGRRVYYVSHEFLLASPLAIDQLEPNVYDVRLPADADCNVLQRTISEADARRMAGGVEQLRSAAAMGAATVVVQHPFWTPLARRLHEQYGWPIVYDRMDDFAPLYRQGEPMLEIERALLDRADLILASSDVLQRKTAAPSRRVALVRNAADYEHFSQASPAAPNGDNVVVGYYGAIAHWFDCRLVARLAHLRPNWRFDLVGNTFTAELAPLRHLPNVRLLGEKPYAELPQCLSEWHCCMIPFQRNEVTEATNPVKIYEMLAAGMPVVAVDLPELRPIAAAGLIELADGAEGFAGKVSKLLAGQSPAVVAARREFARQNTWETRYGEMSSAIERLFAELACAAAVKGGNGTKGGERQP